MSVSVSIGGDSRSSVPDDEVEVFEAKERDWVIVSGDSMSLPLALALVVQGLWVGGGTAAEFRLVDRGRGRKLGDGVGLE